MFSKTGKPVGLRLESRVSKFVKTNAKIAEWSATRSKDVIQRQGVAPFVFLQGFPGHPPDHFAFLAKALPPGLFFR